MNRFLGKLGLIEAKTTGANYCVYGEGAEAVSGGDRYITVHPLTTPLFSTDSPRPARKN